MYAWAERATCLDWSLAALLLTGLSGVPGLAFARGSQVGAQIAGCLLIAGAVPGMAAALAFLLGSAAAQTATFAGPLPALALHVRLDPLAAFFLVPVHALGALGTLYGLRYWRQAEHPASGRQLRLCFGLLIAALAGVLLAADAVAFLLAWEVMAICAYLLVTTEDEHAEVRQAGWVYLVSTHAGTLALLALFALLWASTGALEFRPLPSNSTEPWTASWVFALALLGFGLKAGIVPMHFWLPAAHASAPSHVSALLSGVVLKMGIYGLLRVLMLLPPAPAAVGFLVLAIGACSAVYGVLFALGQHDLKRLLAYHSIENIGIIVTGMGLALLGVSAQQPAWVALGLGGCLLHVWNHALFKALLFLAAGAVIQGTGTREIDRLGGLAKSMPRTAGLFAVGAASICALPPLNGFASELLIYVGLFRASADGIGGVWPAASVAAPLLALAGALALACFVKAFGGVFLGPSRSTQTAGAREAPPSMLLAMALLALGCIAIGSLPALLMPVLDRVVASWAPLHSAPAALAELLPWYPLMGMNALLVVVVLGVSLLLRVRSRHTADAQGLTWDCGYLRPAGTMAYTASSFAQILVELHGWLLRPRSVDCVGKELFARPRRFHTEVPERVLETVLAPGWAAFRRTMLPLRALQQGRVQQYLMYVFLTLFALLAASVPVEGWMSRWLGW